MRRIGLTLTPGVLMSISRNVMPSCFCAAGSVRTRQEHPVGPVGVRRPDLLAVDDEVVAVEHGARLQAREVRAGAGLGVALAPANLAADDARQVLALELVAALVKEQRSDHRQAEADERGAELEARISSCSALPSADESPPPPYSFGHVGAVQPRSPMTFSHFATSGGNWTFLPPGQTSSSERGRVNIDFGALASSHSRASARKRSKSVMAGSPRSSDVT